MNRLFFLILLTLTLNAQNKDITLVLPWKHQFQFAGYYVAKERGFYDKAGLNVKIKEYDLQRDNTKDVSTLKYEFGVGHSSLILDKLNKYPNIFLLNAVHQSSPLVLLSKKRADITSLKDIAGKKIMMSRDHSFTASINAMLFSEHLKIDSYTTIDTSFKPIGLINGNADLMIAYSSNEPFILKEKGIESTIFDPKDYDYDFYSDILFTSAQMIQNNPDDVKAFYRASIEGWKYAYAHIDEGVDIILKHYNTQNKSKKALFFEAQTLKKLAFKDDTRFGEINRVRLKEMINTYRLLGLVDENRKIDFNSFVHPISQDYTFTKKSISAEDKNYFNHIFIDSIYFKIFIVILLLTIFIALYFKIKMDKIIALKTAQLERQNDIFNKNISSSRTDLNGKITYVSEAFCKVSGYSKDELIGKTHRMLKDKSVPDSIYKDLWLTISSGHTWSGEIKNIKKDTTSYWIYSIISPIFDNNNNIVAYEAIRQDITLKKVLKEFNKKLEEEVKERTVELEKLAITDKLTGIYNRFKLDEELSHNYAHYLRYNRVYSIILIDIDFFKNINDTYGHQVGDDVLQKLSSTLELNIRTTDTLGRWGGEEFLIILPDTDIDGAYALAEHIREKIEDIEFESVGKVTISGGVSQINSSSNQKRILAIADKALYRAKEKGRNRIEK